MNNKLLLIQSILDASNVSPHIYQSIASAMTSRGPTSKFHASKVIDTNMSAILCVLSIPPDFDLDLLKYFISQMIDAAMHGTLSFSKIDQTFYLADLDGIEMDSVQLNTQKSTNVTAVLDNVYFYSTIAHAGQFNSPGLLLSTFAAYVLYIHFCSQHHQVVMFFFYVNNITKFG